MNFCNKKKIIDQTIPTALTIQHTPHSLTSWINNLVILWQLEFMYLLSSNQTSTLSIKCVGSANFSRVQPSKFIYFSLVLRSVSWSFESLFLWHGCSKHVPFACSLTVWNLTCCYRPSYLFLHCCHVRNVRKFWPKFTRPFLYRLYSAHVSHENRTETDYSEAFQ